MYYAGQPITASVTARGLSGTVLQNFQGKLARPVTLAAVASEGGAALAAGAGVLSDAALAATVFGNGVAPATPAFTLPVPYLNNGTNGGFSAPLDVFLRADQVESPTSENISSLRAPASSSVEGGTRIVVGRLFVPHGYGSELLKRQVQIRAQYWTGTGWENSSTDGVTPNAFTPVFNPCTGTLVQAGTTCKAVLGNNTVPPAAGPLINGTATYRFGASNAGSIGIASVRMNGPAWLPSSTGRWRYGIYKPSPVIYIREVF